MLWKMYSWYYKRHNIGVLVTLRILWTIMAFSPVLIVFYGMETGIVSVKAFIWVAGVTGTLVLLSSMPYYILNKNHPLMGTGDFVQKWVMTLIGALVAGIPLWLFLFIKSALNPDGFWQQLVVNGLGIYFLGSIQLVFLFLFIWWLFKVWE